MNILFVSLGCDKNLVDTEMMLGMLSEHGHEFTDDENEAEVVVVNTCCFIHDAKEESIETILEAASYKEQGKCRVLIVTGCLAQRYKEEILAEIPGRNLPAQSAEKPHPGFADRPGADIRGRPAFPGGTGICFAQDRIHDPQNEQSAG